MRSYLQLKQERDGYRDVADTVKTVEKIAASEIHNMRQRLEVASQHHSAIEILTQALIRRNKGKTGIRWSLPVESPGSVFAVVFGGERGLVGSLYRAIAEKCTDLGTARIVVVGERMAHVLSSLGTDWEKKFSWSQPNQVITAINALVRERFARGSRVILVYPQFLTLSEHRVQVTPLLPIPTNTSPPSIPDSGIPIFSPSVPTLLDAAGDQWISSQLYLASVHAQLSELAARTIAMQEASENSDRIYEDYARRYFKARRNELTAEQLENFTAHEII